MWHTYILLCKDGSLYTGATNDIEKRLQSHKSGKGGRYTRSHQPIGIVYSESFATQSAALKREAQIKSWTRVQKFERLKIVDIGRVQRTNLS